MIAFLSEVYNETEVNPVPLNFCGLSSDSADPKQYQPDEGLRAEFARLFSCPLCLGKKKPSAFEFSSEDSEAMLREFSFHVDRILGAKKEIKNPEKVPLVRSCSWAAYASDIGIAVLNATAVKAIDGSLVLSESMPHPLRQAVVEYSRTRNTANGFLRELRNEKREAERRIKQSLNS